MKSLLWFLYLTMGMSIVGYAQQDTVIYNPVTGDYMIQYMRENQETGIRDSLVTVIFVPATKISPTVHATIAVERDADLFLYQYSIANGADSKQNLLHFYVQFGKGVDVVDKSTNRWMKGRHRGFQDESLNRIWSWHGDQGLEPTWSTGGFALGSNGLPGIGNAYFQGNAPITGYPSEVPYEVLKQVARIDMFPANHVHRTTVVPVLPPEPFVAIAFIDTLLSYTRQSAELGWLAPSAGPGKRRDDDCDDDERPDDGITKNIEQRLQKAKRELAKRDSLQARKELEKLVQKVERIWKRSQEDEKKHRKDRWEKRDQVIMTSEAYALLKYNTEYLTDRLPEKTKQGRRDDEKDKKPKK